MLTEKQAWEKIAEAFATTHDSRNYTQLILTLHGVCSAITRSTVTKIVRVRMYNKVYQCLTVRQVYFCKLLPINDKIRADFCHLMYFQLGGE